MIILIVVLSVLLELAIGFCLGRLYEHRRNAYLIMELQRSTQSLSESVQQNQPPTEGTVMNPILQTLADQVAASVQVEASAKTLIDGIGARVQAAVDAAIQNGATAEQLAPVQAEADALKQSGDALAASIMANTPAPAPAAAQPAVVETEAPAA